MKKPIVAVQLGPGELCLSEVTEQYGQNCPDFIINDAGAWLFLPNWYFVYAANSRGELRVLDLQFENRKVNEICKISLQGFSADAIMTLPDGNIIVGSSNPVASLRIFNPYNGMLIKTFPQYQSSISTLQQLIDCMEFAKRREMEKNCQVLMLAKRREGFFNKLPNEMIRKIVLYTSDIFNNIPELAEPDLKRSSLDL